MRRKLIRGLDAVAVLAGVRTGEFSLAELGQIHASVLDRINQKRRHMWLQSCIAPGDKVRIVAPFTRWHGCKGVVRRFLRTRFEILTDSGLIRVHVEFLERDDADQ